MATITAFCQEEEGSTAIEYALLVTLTSVVAIVAFGAVANALSSKFNQVSTAVMPVLSS